MRFVPSVERCEDRKLLSAVVYGPNSATISDVFGHPVANVATPVPGTLERADMHGLYLPFVDLRGADMRGANMNGFSSPFGNFTNADMENVTAVSAAFNFATMDGVDLMNATMGDGTGAHGVALLYVTMRGANLQSADLDHASLYHADMTGANWQGADLTDAWLDGVIGGPNTAFVIADPVSSTF